MDELIIYSYHELMKNSSYDLIVEDFKQHTDTLSFNYQSEDVFYNNKNASINLRGNFVPMTLDFKTYLRESDDDITKEKFINFISKKGRILILHMKSGYKVRKVICVLNNYKENPVGSFGDWNIELSFKTLSRFFRTTDYIIDNTIVIPPPDPITDNGYYDSSYVEEEGYTYPFKLGKPVTRHTKDYDPNIYYTINIGKNGGDVEAYFDIICMNISSNLKFGIYPSDKLADLTDNFNSFHLKEPGWDSNLRINSFPFQPYIESRSQEFLQDLFYGRDNSEALKDDNYLSFIEMPTYIQGYTGDNEDYEFSVMGSKITKVRKYELFNSF